VIFFPFSLNEGKQTPFESVASALSCWHNDAHRIECV
jgi:hypothetical protein